MVNAPTINMQGTREAIMRDARYGRANSDAYFTQHGYSAGQIINDRNIADTATNSKAGNDLVNVGEKEAATNAGYKLDADKLNAQLGLTTSNENANNINAYNIARTRLFGNAIQNADTAAQTHYGRANELAIAQALSQYRLMRDVSGNIVPIYKNTQSYGR